MIRRAAFAAAGVALRLIHLRALRRAWEAQEIHEIDGYFAAIRTHS